MTSKTERLKSVKKGMRKTKTWRSPSRGFRIGASVEIVERVEKMEPSRGTAVSSTAIGPKAIPMGGLPLGMGQLDMQELRGKLKRVAPKKFDPSGISPKSQKQDPSAPIPFKTVQVKKIGGLNSSPDRNAARKNWENTSTTKTIPQEDPKLDTYPQQIMKRPDKNTGTQVSSPLEALQANCAPQTDSLPFNHEKQRSLPFLLILFLFLLLLVLILKLVPLIKFVQDEKKSKKFIIFFFFYIGGKLWTVEIIKGNW